MNGVNEKILRHVSRLRKMEVVKKHMSRAKHTSVNALMNFDESWHPNFNNIYQGIRMAIYFYSKAPSFGRAVNQIKNISV